MDGKVSYDDFKEAVSHDSLLLELLGQCFPAEKVITIIITIIIIIVIVIVSGLFIIYVAAMPRI